MAYELFVDSFDTRTFSTATTLSDDRWVLFGTAFCAISTSAGAGRHGSSSLRLACSSNAGSYIQTKTFAAATHLVVGFWRKVTSGLADSYIGLRKGANTLITLNITSTGAVSVVLGGVTYTASKSLTSNSYVELGVVIGNSGSLELRVNGSSSGWLALSGVDTQPASDTSVDSVIVGATGRTVGTVDHDDLYITYGDELKWLGDIRVDALVLTGDSTPQDWTPDTGNAWERLNNTSTGYITGTTLDDESLFTLTDYSAVTTAIHGVQVSAHGRKTDAGSRSMAIEIKSNTTTDVGSTIALSDATTEYRDSWTVDPDTSSAWTDSGLDALELGVKVMS